MVSNESYVKYIKFKKSVHWEGKLDFERADYTTFIYVSGIDQKNNVGNAKSDDAITVGNLFCKDYDMSMC